MSKQVYFCDVCDAPATHFTRESTDETETDAWVIGKLRVGCDEHPVRYQHLPTTFEEKFLLACEAVKYPYAYTAANALSVLATLAEYIRHPEKALERIQFEKSLETRWHP